MSVGVTLPIYAYYVISFAPYQLYIEYIEYVN